MSDTTIPPQFTSALGDPFDPAGASNLHQPGMLGVSPDVWRSLANFGGNLAAAANARTPQGFLQYGGGFAGPFGAAVSASQGQGLQRGVDLSHMALNRAQSQSAQMDNYIKAMNLPLQLAQNRLMLEMMQDPQAWAAKYGFGNPTLSAGTPAAGSGGSTDNWKPAFGGATNAPQVPKEYIPFYEEASKRTGIPISVLQAQSAQESGFNPGATGSAGEIGIDQIKPDTARNPGYGLTGVQNPDVLRDPRTNILFGADYLKARAGGNVDWTDPAQVAAALRSYNGGGDAQYAQHVMRYIPASQPQTAAAPAASSPYTVASNTPVAPPSQPAQSGGGYANYPENNPAATGGQPTPVGNLGLVRNPDGSIGTPGGGFGGKPTPQPQAQTAPAPAPQPQAQQQQAQPSQADVLMARATNYEQQANQLENQRSQITVENARRANFIKTLPAPMQMLAAQNPGLQPLPMPPGDPAALRTAAQQFRQNALELQNAGPIAAAKAPYNLQRVPPGGVIFDGNGKPIGAAPFQSHEVLSSGPNAGAEVTVLRDPRNNQIITGTTPNGGAQGEGGQSGASNLPPGALQTKLPPQQEGRLKAQGEVEKEDLNHDRTTVEGDLEHVIDTVTPAKQQLFQLRSLVDSADTGAAGQFRAEFKNWVQTFAPDFVSKITGDASPAQEFDKIALMGAGKQERGDLGARGGFRAIEMYRNANPSMDKTPQANHDMANALLISHQYHEDYAMGAVDYYQKNRSAFLNPGAPGEYKPISSYDPQFTKVMRPELYASAIGAINGKPYGEWAKGLSNKQIQIVGGIVQRADPSAVVDIQGHQVPVSSFKTTIGPTDIAGAGGPGAG